LLRRPSRKAGRNYVGVDIELSSIYTPKKNLATNAANIGKPGAKKKANVLGLSGVELLAGPIDVRCSLERSDP